MLHDVAIIFLFLAMVIAPCAITLRSQRDTDDSQASPVPPTHPLPRTR